VLAIHALLEKMPEVKVMAEASDGRTALELIRIDPPDIVLMDIGMDGLNGLAPTARISQEFVTVRVIILSMHSDEEYVLQALQAGAMGYLVKAAATAELELALPRSHTRRDLSQPCRLQAGH
jgi:DNA-binding NarL/FixJ family response regulator